MRYLKTFKQLKIAPKPLLYAAIQEDMMVTDSDGDGGIITDCKDPHNVIIEYENGGRGLHCMVEGCNLYGRSFLYERISKEQSNHLNKTIKNE
jgi:hypothetical protein